MRRKWLKIRGLSLKSPISVLKRAVLWETFFTICVSNLKKYLHQGRVYCNISSVQRCRENELYVLFSNSLSYAGVWRLGIEVDRWGELP